VWPSVVQCFVLFCALYLCFMTNDDGDICCFVGIVCWGRGPGGRVVSFLFIRFFLFVLCWAIVVLLH
jgi:hypothetical protein